MLRFHGDRILTGETGCSGHGDVVAQVKAMQIEAACVKVLANTACSRSGLVAAFQESVVGHVPPRCLSSSRNSIWRATRTKLQSVTFAFQLEGCCIAALGRDWMEVDGEMRPFSSSPGPEVSPTISSWELRWPEW